jgi:hypothetical protein
MTPRERVRACLNHEEPDRVPIALGQATGDGITIGAPDGWTDRWLDVPPENVVAMHEAAAELGAYPLT